MADHTYLTLANVQDNPELVRRGLHKVRSEDEEIYIWVTENRRVLRLEDITMGHLVNILTRLADQFTGFYEWAEEIHIISGELLKQKNNGKN